MKLALERHRLSLAQELATAYGPVRERELLVIELTGADGLSGYGEAAPLPAYDGPGSERVLAALTSHRAVLADAGASADGAQLLDACRAADPLPQALAAIDMALWDRAGKRAERPVAELLSDNPAAAVAVNATIGALDRASAAEQAARAVAAGFGCLKLKVGTGDDAGRVAAVRAVTGGEVDLRLDANGAWEPDQAVATIEALAPVGLELVEEPCHGLEAVREVRARVPVRISIDETAGEPGALTAGVADAVCLKISRSGGIAALLAAASLVRASGAEAYLASTIDGPLGIAAALHAAAALASRGPVPACGLATLPMLEGIAAQLPVVRGAIAVPRTPGLGVEPL